MLVSSPRSRDLYLISFPISNLHVALVIPKKVNMASPKNAELIRAAEEFAESVKAFDGDASVQMKLLKQADKLRFLLETPMETIMKQ